MRVPIVSNVILNGPLLFLNFDIIPLTPLCLFTSIIFHPFSIPFWNALPLSLYTFVTKMESGDSFIWNPNGLFSKWKMLAQMIQILNFDLEVQNKIMVIDPEKKFKKENFKLPLNSLKFDFLH